MNEIFDPDFAEARDLIREIHAECPDLIVFLHEVAARHGSHWQHHLPAMQRAIERVRARCNHELACWRKSRLDGAQPNEVADNIARQFCELTEWLSRMTR